MARFACAGCCIDGRVQELVANYLKRIYGVQFVDMVNRKGINLILALNKDLIRILDIRDEMETSVNGHGSEIIAIVGHPDCGGNLAEKEEQIEHLRAAKKTVEGFGLNAQVVLLWVEDNKEVIAVAA